MPLRVLIACLLWVALSATLTGCCSSPFMGCGTGPMFGNACCDTGASHYHEMACDTQMVAHDHCEIPQDPCQASCRPKTDWNECLADSSFRTYGWLDEESHRFLSYSKCKTQRFRKLFQPGCDNEHDTHGAKCTSCGVAHSHGPAPKSPAAPLIPAVPPTTARRSGGMIPPGSYYSRPVTAPQESIPQLGSPPEPGMVPLGDGSWASPWREVAPGERQSTSETGPSATRPTSFREPTLMPADVEG